MRSHRSGDVEWTAAPESLVRGILDTGAGLLELASRGRCGACRREARAPLCAACLARCSRPSGPCCRRCGEGFRASDGATCGRCERFGRPFAFDRAIAMWSYQGPVRDLVHAFKFRGRAELLVPLGRWMAQDPAIGSYGRHSPGALVVPVPASVASRRRRGFDQTVLLAQGLALGLRRPWNARALVRRREPDQPQARSLPKERRAGPRAGFLARPALVAGRPVLLVDDVLSTGATGDAAARALRVAGAPGVTFLSLAT